MSRKTFAIALGCLSLVCALPTFANDESKALESGREYLIATNYPSNLNIIDLKTDQIYKTCHMPDVFGPGTAQISPDRKTAYVLSNHYGDIYGIDLDSCKTVFRANLAFKPGERAKAIFSIAVSRDGKEVYSVANPAVLLNDRFTIGTPRLQVYDTSSGLSALPVRTFDVPRQISIMQVGHDGSLYMAGAGIYKMDVHSGKYEIVQPIRNWGRPLYSDPDVLYVWPHQTLTDEFALLYSAVKYQDKSKDPATAENVYGQIIVDLKTGKTSVQDFATLTELYFTGLRSPKNPGQMFGVLNRLAKYDIKSKKLIGSATLEHTYYCVAFNKDGSKLYLAGTYNEIAVYDPENLERKGTIKLPGGDSALMTAQVFTR
ncbi:quinohemoprotein amine dehydrogenase subunit beta [Pseudomonas sp. BGr12]|uniref:quinohemoprotein amine dehydrogenase subunit beta n=1 Tax=Pseudomonas sp. BGr12 TaxID=2936269 RepID=UPI002559CCF7|nr:quinohemoprotein amine dehydrogenase subunit beta [Pseudomonas sp. BJa5]MDL2428434.1 quinohemoprotein amine dehydrogenase subunit beta [Pseudomonas sp. BJa5]